MPARFNWKAQVGETYQRFPKISAAASYIVARMFREKTGRRPYGAILIGRHDDPVAVIRPCVVKQGAVQVDWNEEPQENLTEEEWTQAKQELLNTLKDRAIRSE